MLESLYYEAAIQDVEIKQLSAVRKFKLIVVLDKYRQTKGK